MNVEAWFKDLTDSSSLREAAEKSGVSKSTLSRNLDANTMTPETVIALCRAYDRSPVAGLIETGYINDYEIHGPDVEVALKEATNEQLLDEIMRRSDPQARYLFGNEADDDAIGLAPDAEVFDFPTPDVHLGPYAADDSPNEPEEGDEGFHDGP